MCRSRALQRLVFGCLVAGAALAAAVGSAGPPPARPLYDPDPQHLWNRLHEALLVRTGPDGRAYGQDRLEPLLWPGTKHLLEDRSCDRAVAVLEEFTRSQGEKLIDDPLKRAVLQRDLWLVFNWLEGPHETGADPRLTPEAARASQRRLRRPLAAVIGRLALSPDEIKHLPDNYAAAVASGEFAKRYDPEQPDRPFLPPDLFAADGPWVCLGRPDGPVAPAHLRDGGNAFTNSVFLVFLRLSAGRAATLEYLKRLRAFDQPLLVRAERAEKRSEKYLPNPKLPPFPVGTEVALVRRALLIDSTHAIRPTALTESVQLRVYREIPDMTWQTLDVGSMVDGSAANRRAHRWQAFHEFRLSRSLLFAGRAGGLRAVGPDERDFETGFGGPYHYDAFEDDFPHRPGQEAIKESCFACHGLPGVYSFNSFFFFRGAGDLQNGHAPRPASLAETSPAEVGESAVQWKQGRPHWTSLRKLLAE